MGTHLETDSAALGTVPKQGTGAQCQHSKEEKVSTEDTGSESKVKRAGNLLANEVVSTCQAHYMDSAPQNQLQLVQLYSENGYSVAVSEDAKGENPEMESNHGSGDDNPDCHGQQPEHDVSPQSISPKESIKRNGDRRKRNNIKDDPTVKLVNAKEEVFKDNRSLYYEAGREGEGRQNAGSKSCLEAENASSDVANPNQSAIEDAQRIRRSNDLTSEQHPPPSAEEESSLLALKTHAALALLDSIYPLLTLIPDPEARLTATCFCCIVFSSWIPLFIIRLNFRVVASFVSFESVKQAIGNLLICYVSPNE